MVKGIVRLDRVQSVYGGNIDSVVHTADLENGMIVQSGDLVKGREVRKVIVPTTGSGNLRLVSTPEINKSEYSIADGALENCYTPAGKPARAYNLVRSDIFSVSTDMVKSIGTEPKKGNYVVADGLKYKEVDKIENEEFIGKIIDLETIGVPVIVGQAGVKSRINKLVVIEVLKN